MPCNFGHTLQLPTFSHVKFVETNPQDQGTNPAYVTRCFRLPTRKTLCVCLCVRVCVKVALAEIATVFQVRVCVQADDESNMTCVFPVAFWKSLFVTITWQCSERDSYNSDRKEQHSSLHHLNCWDSNFLGGENSTRCQCDFPLQETPNRRMESNRVYAETRLRLCLVVESGEQWIVFLWNQLSPSNWIFQVKLRFPQLNLYDCTWQVLEYNDIDDEANLTGIPNNETFWNKHNLSSLPWSDFNATSDLKDNVIVLQVDTSSEKLQFLTNGSLSFRVSWPFFFRMVCLLVSWFAMLSNIIRRVCPVQDPWIGREGGRSTSFVVHTGFRSVRLRLGPCEHNL